jgi:hypothetical protein
MYEQTRSTEQKQPDKLRRSTTTLCEVCALFTYGHVLQLLLTAYYYPFRKIRLFAASASSPTLTRTLNTSL